MIQHIDTPDYTLHAAIRPTDLFQRRLCGSRFLYPLHIQKLNRTAISVLLFVLFPYYNLHSIAQYYSKYTYTYIGSWPN